MKNENAVIAAENELKARDNPIERIMDNAFGKLRNMSRTDTVIGEEIEVGEFKVVPVSKVSMGFVTGGGEYSEADAMSDFPFAGASGAGMSVQPVCFLVTDGKTIKVVGLSSQSPFDKILTTIPDIVSGLVKKKK